MKENVDTSALHDAMVPRFWRDDAFPFIEARAVHDGSNVCYAKHTHETFSIGVITHGACTYINERLREPIGVGSVVVINPGDVHACNPLGREAWSYRMLYVDIPWLAKLQHEAGLSKSADFRRFSTALTSCGELYRGLNQLHTLLTAGKVDALRKQCALLTFFTELQCRLNPAPESGCEHNYKLARAAEYIRENCTRALKLDDICAAAELSASYLIRAFKRCYGMTPHMYLINRRVDYCRTQLRRGRTIAEVAIEAGFCDQAHLQRVFRQFMAATPGQYRRGT
jgi:AraC-like DNA-binding protein